MIYLILNFNMIYIYIYIYNFVIFLFFIFNKHINDIKKPIKKCIMTVFISFVIN